MEKCTILLWVFIWLFPACAKYEEGPWLSLQSKAKRLEGSWFVEQAFDPEGNNYKAEFDGQIYTFTRDGSLSIRFARPDTTETVEGSWQFIDLKDGLRWTLEADSLRLDSLSFPYGSPVEFDILRLAKGDLRLIDPSNRRLFFSMSD